MEFKDNLRKIRKEREMTQKDVCKILNVSLNGYAKLGAGAYRTGHKNHRQTL